MHAALLAFVEGFGLILSPCILPILPIVLAASLQGGRRRPFGIIIGFVASFALFALLARELINALQLDPQLLQNIALFLLALLGGVMLIPALDRRFAAATTGMVGFAQNAASRFSQGDGFGNGLAIGALIGLVWTPCAGPIMAVAVVQIIQAKTDMQAALTVVMFAAGAGLPMLAIALAGRSLLVQLSFLKPFAGRIKQVMGAVILASVLLVYSGVATRLLADATVVPSADRAIALAMSEGTLYHALPYPRSAPELTGLAAWINSPPLTLESLRGKTVLIDFWTYSCINCVRTLPYVTAWDKKYRDKGLVILGLHAPEFAFEKKLSNVQDAVRAHNINYPVALDNDLATWSAFKNNYWPAHYLINREGQIVYTHFGEGNYDVTEHNIRVLLGLKDGEDAVAEPSSSGGTSPWQSPETYLGYERARNFMSPEGMQRDQTATYRFPAKLPLNHWALAGQWHVAGQNITAMTAGAALRYRFSGGRVFLVLGSASGQPLSVSLKLNGKDLGTAAGKSVQEGKVLVAAETLYELVNQGQVLEGELEITCDAPGVQAYAFTFGG